MIGAIAMFIIAIIFMSVFIVQSKRVRSYKKTIETDKQIQEWEKDKVPIAASKFSFRFFKYFYEYERKIPYCFDPPLSIKCLLINTCVKTISTWKMMLGNLVLRVYYDRMADFIT